MTQGHKRDKKELAVIKKEVEALLKANYGNMNRVSKIMKCSRAYLYLLTQQIGIDPDVFRPMGYKQRP